MLKGTNNHYMFVPLHLVKKLVTTYILFQSKIKWLEEGADGEERVGRDCAGQARGGFGQAVNLAN